MRKIILIIAGIVICNLTFGQIVNFQIGTSISSLRDKVNNTCFCTFAKYDKNLVGYAVFAGVDYLDKKYFNLSTNIGMISKGGKENEQTQNGILTGNVIMNYFSVNTALDLKFPIKDKFIPYLSFGPRFDNSLFDNNILSNFKSTSIGLIFGGGLKFDLNKYQLGLRYDYYQDFTKLVDTYGISRYQRAFDINMTLGYKLK